MSILSDRQIKALCMKPTHFIRGNGKWDPVIAGVTHTPERVALFADTPYNVAYDVHGVTSDADYEKYGWKPMIDPFVPHAVRTKDVNGKEQKIISYGLSSYGYDIRASVDDIKIFSNINTPIIDVMRMNERSYVAPIVHFDEEFQLHYFILPPKSVALAHTMEYFNIPRNVLVTCLGKSTYARVAIMPIVTPLEPGWSGELVLEIANLIECPIRVYLECGIAQLIFNEGSEECEVSYADRDGKYQGQKGTTDARI